MLNTACKAQTNRKFANWKKTAAQGAWEVQDPLYIWPTGALAQEDDDDDQGRTGNSQVRLMLVCNQKIWG